MTTDTITNIATALLADGDLSLLATMSGRWVPVGGEQPTMKIDALTVGGTQT